VIRQIEIIGEATRRISQVLRKNTVHIPWQGIAGMHDALIHDYFGVDIGQVWFTATEDLPRFSPEQVSHHGIGERPSIFGILRRTFSIASILASVIRAFALMKKWLIRPQDD